ncbi:MAG: rhodanese-like domain-containing protein [Psychroflexus sp.]|nr:rhodanese-like domain-containing protein [Psychroflexus sp.]MDN6309089.1 rhodanese-like domain-containing protein [Psychroflexus sp.]
MSKSNLQAIKDLLDQKNKASIPYLSVQDLQKQLSQNSDFILLDTREKNEFDVSHLPNAIWVGFENFDIQQLIIRFPKRTEFVLYCSLGMRSERIGNQLEKVGYSQLKNLYGGIFQWADQGFQLVNKSGLPTQKVHAYNSHWGQFLTTTEAVYD